MTKTTLAVVDVLYWPTVQLALSAIIVRAPARLFARDNRLTEPRAHELTVYRRLLVSRWKKHLPDAAPWVGGQSKSVDPFDATSLTPFLAQIRRAEIAHWLQLACAAPCWLWNPPWAALVMTSYAILSNLPCILAQRYNRAILQRRSLAKGATRARRTPAPAANESL